MEQTLRRGWRGRWRAHPLLPFQFALCRSIEPGDVDGGTERPGRQVQLEGVQIDEAIGGAVVTHSRTGTWHARRCSAANWHHPRPASPLQQACGTSLQAAMILQAKIATGQIRSGIAMGSDTTSDAPIVFKEKFAHRLVEAQNAKSFGQRLAAFKGFSPAELAPQPPSVSEPRTGLSMGQHTELMAQEWQSRAASKTGSPWRATARPPKPTARAISTTLSCRLRGVFSRQQPARGHEPRPARQPGSRHSTNPSAAP